ncbi:ABC-type nitrate/sulfonate/bicarbonate transport system permease component [Rhizobium sp. BK313]|nr:ABC-type nitrate/sulfonate/bicarbonate transport system permease component [Rhizobium sp. BK313]
MRGFLRGMTAVAMMLASTFSAGAAEKTDISITRNLFDIPSVFAGLLTVIVIGLIVENLVFQTIERRTLQKWGMKE